MIPAVLAAERLLGALGLARGARISPVRVATRASRALQLAGAAMLLSPLAWPVEELAAAEPARLAARMRAAGAPAEPARARVWVRPPQDAVRRSATWPSS